MLHVHAGLHTMLQVSHSTRLLLLSHAKHVCIKPSRQSRVGVLVQLLELPPGLL
jgi:hypothetical protein